MRIFNRLLIAMTFAAALFAFAAPASAQATRTWVSGVGDDANPCSRTAPCKTFAGAISKTATGGEINCLDPGGFGGVTITKSLSIVCDHTEGGVLSAGAGVNGMVINAPATSIVFLSGLDFNGAGNAQNGIRIIAGAAIHVQNSIIRNYAASNGLGISFQPSGTTELFITNTSITDNGNGLTGGGILVQPTGAAGSAKVVMKGVRVNNNANNGMFVNTTGATSAAGVKIVADQSSFSGNEVGVSVLTPAATSPAAVIVTDSIIAHNVDRGLLTNGATAEIRVAFSTITGNGRGVSFQNGSTLVSYGDNRNFGNTNNGTFSAAVLATQ